MDRRDILASKAKAEAAEAGSNLNSNNSVSSSNMSNNSPISPNKSHSSNSKYYQQNQHYEDANWKSDIAKQILLERELKESDFEDTLELKFVPQGSSEPPVPTPPHKLNFSFKFKVYDNDFMLGNL